MIFRPFGPWNIVSIIIIFYSIIELNIKLSESLISRRALELFRAQFKNDGPRLIPLYVFAYVPKYIISNLFIFYQNS